MGAEASNVVELPIGRGPGERLRAARTAAGLTLQGVADDLHLGVDALVGRLGRRGRLAC